MGTTIAKIGLLATGSELLDGRICDRNGQNLAHLLAPLGIDISRIVVCGDSQQEIVAGLTCFDATFDAVFITGGLGPTEADQTRAALATFAGEELISNQAAVDKLHTWLQARNRQPIPQDIHQTFFPTSAQRIENNFGSADGFTLTLNGVLYIALPGVPYEFKNMCQTLVLPILAAAMTTKGYALTKRTLYKRYCFGLSEAAVANYLTYSNGLRIRATMPCIEIAAYSKDLLLEATNKIPEEYLYSDNQSSLPEIVAALLTEKKKTVTTAESCTGGLIASLLTKIPKISEVFVGGLVTYSNSLKTQLLGVQDETIQQYGAVSSECVREMALGALSRCQSDYALSISGIAGPEGGTIEKPIGTIYIGLAKGKECTTYTVQLSGDRERIQLFSSWYALDILRRDLLGIEQKLKNE